MKKNDKKRNIKEVPKTNKILMFIKTHLLLSILIGIGALVLVGGSVVWTYTIYKNKNTNYCLVQFETNGGSPIEAQKIKCGTIPKRPKKPKKEGFTFKFWKYGTKEYNFDVSINSDSTIEAIYELDEGVETVTISFETNGGTTVKPIEIKKGEILVKPIAPVKEGYKFIGWFNDYEEFDFNKPVLESIMLRAKWEENSKTKTKEEVKIKNSNGNYKCSGGFRSDIPETEVFVGYNDHVNWTWSTYGSYGGSSIDDCYITYKSSDNNIATVSNEGMINAINEGNVYISECLHDTATKKELVCFKGKLKVLNKKCNYQADQLISPYRNSTYDYRAGSEDDEPLIRQYFTYESDTCILKFTSSNKSVATINSDGKLKAISKGTSIINGCIIDKATKKELECFSFNALVTNSDGSYYDDPELFQNLQGTWYLQDYGTDVYVTFTEAERYGERVLYYMEYGFCAAYGSINPPECYSTGYYSYDMITSPIGGISGYGWSYENGYLFNTSGGTRFRFSKTPSYAHVASVSLSSSDINLNTGDTVSLNVTVLPSHAGNKNVTWASSNPSVVTVSNGTLTAIHSGTAVITVTSEDGNKTASCNVNVKDVSVSSVSLNSTKLDLLRGGSSRLSVSFSPSNATNKNITWTSSDPSIATVSDGLVTAISKGTAIITVTSEDGNKTASCNVNITNPQIYASADVGVAYISTSSGLYRRICAEINASGGSGIFTYYYIKLYKNGTLIGETTDTSQKKLYISGDVNGTYYIEYEIHDSDGTVYTNTSSETTISGF